MLSRSDAKQLAYAVSRRYTILTYNIRDYVDLARYYAENGLDHFGIIVSAQLDFKELFRRALRLLSTYTAEDMKNRFEWLSNFR